MRVNLSNNFFKTFAPGNCHFPCTTQSKFVTGNIGVLFIVQSLSLGKWKQSLGSDNVQSYITEIPVSCITGKSNGVKLPYFD